MRLVPTIRRWMCRSLVAGVALLAGPAFGLEDDALAGFALVHSFDGSEGSHPAAPLILGTDGKLYGTTPAGGAFNVGTAFCMTPGGQFTLLHSFDKHDGGGYPAGLVQGADGDFYGVAAGSGNYRNGSLFRMSHSGRVRRLATFALDGSQGHRPQAPLVQAPDGVLYGTTSGSTLRGEFGSVFRWSPEQGLTLLHLFDDESSRNGARPTAGRLVLAGDGSLYGTTLFGGRRHKGSAYRVAPDGTLDEIHSFKNGMWSGLTDGQDGFLYGVAGGGIDHQDIVFRLSPAGEKTTLHAFEGGRHDGRYSLGELLLGRDGNLYGVTLNGGKHDAGTFYRATRDGAVEVLYSFEPDANGVAWIDAGLVEVADGEFFGISRFGGAHDKGAIYRIRVK